MTLTFLVLYLTSIFAIIVFLLGSCIYLATMLYSVAYRIPLVGTKQDAFITLMRAAKLQKGNNKIFVDLGSGDGRNVLAAAQMGYDATGYEINPMLVILSKMYRHFLPQDISSRAHFVRKNLLDVDLTHVDVVYLFLFPFMLVNLVPQLAQARPGTIIVSHGFRIVEFPTKPFLTISGKPFSTYYYRV